MTFYSDIKAVSGGLIAEFGISFSYSRKSITHDPVLGDVTSTQVDNSGLCVITKITKSFEGFENVQSGDKLLLTTSDVQRGDVVTLQSKDYEVEALYPVEPSGEMVLNKVLIR